MEAQSSRTNFAIVQTVQKADFIIKVGLIKCLILARDAQAKLALIVAQILSICPSICTCVCPRQLERSIARREPHQLPACHICCDVIVT